MAGKRKGEAKPAAVGADEAASAPAAGQSDLPELDEECSLPMSVFIEMTPEDLAEICRRAGKDFGGVSIVGDRAYL